MQSHMLVQFDLGIMDLEVQFRCQYHYHQQQPRSQILYRLAGMRLCVNRWVLPGYEMIPYPLSNNGIYNVPTPSHMLV